MAHKISYVAFNELNRKSEAFICILAIEVLHVRVTFPVISSRNFAAKENTFRRMSDLRDKPICHVGAIINL